MPVDPPKVSASKGHAVPVEKLQDLDRDFATIVKPIAKLRGRKLPVGSSSGKIGRYREHLRDHGAREEMIVRNFIDLAHSGEQFQQSPNLGFRR